MLKLALERQWNERKIASPVYVVGWADMGSSVGVCARRRRNAPRFASGHRPLYMDKRYGLPKRPRKQVAPCPTH